MNSEAVHTMIGGREALLEATGHHPYVMLTTTGDVTGYRGDGLLAWVDPDPDRPQVWALGDGRAAVEFVRSRVGGLTGWAHLPHLTPEQAAPLRSDIHDDWDHLITRTAPPPVAGADRVVAVDDHREIDALLDLAFPESTSRPGDPRVRAWHGIRHGNDLVAVAADRSRGGIGYLAGIAVHPEHRQRSHGTVLTATLTRRLFDEFGGCSLSVMSYADGPRRIYGRLGYGEPLARSSLRL